MVTKFPKFEEDFMKKWMSYFHAGTEWLQNFQMLNDARIQPSHVFLFWVYPHVLYFSLELFVKSQAAFVNNDFDAKKEKFGHSATKIIRAYKDKIDLFLEIESNLELMSLISEYEKTIDTRFGETYVQLDNNDTKILMELVFKLREDMCKKTGLR